MKMKWILATAIAAALGCSAPPKGLSPGRTLHRQAEAAVAEKRYDDALALYSRLEKEEPRAAAMSAVRIGDILLLQGRRDAAYSAYERAVELYPRGSMSYGAYDRLKELNGDQNNAPGTYFRKSNTTP